MKNNCAHKDHELFFEEYDGWPCLVEVRCEDCGADVTYQYSEHERAEMERDERSFQFDAQYESAKDAWLESMRESAE